MDWSDDCQHGVNNQVFGDEPKDFRHISKKHRSDSCTTTNPNLLPFPLQYNSILISEGPPTPSPPYSFGHHGVLFSGQELATGMDRYGGVGADDDTAYGSENFLVDKHNPQQSSHYQNSDYFQKTSLGRMDSCHPSKHETNQSTCIANIDDSIFQRDLNLHHSTLSTEDLSNQTTLMDVDSQVSHHQYLQCFEANVINKHSHFHLQSQTNNYQSDASFDIPSKNQLLDSNQQNGVKAPIPTIYSNIDGTCLTASPSLIHPKHDIVMDDVLMSVDSSGKWFNGDEQPTANKYNAHQNMSAKDKSPKRRITNMPFQFRMGFRPTCEKCVNKVPGHFSHLD